MNYVYEEEKVAKKAFDDIGQGQIFNYWHELNQQERLRLMESLKGITVEDCQIAWNDMQAGKRHIGQPQSPEAISGLNPCCQSLQTYRDIGDEIICKGKVAAFTVAGGQGTRLGHNGPKGTYTCTPLRNMSLFGHFAESIKFFSNYYGRSPWWFIMTSEENHLETVQFFTKMNFFGLEKKMVKFFKQGMMPVFDLNGKILLKEKHQVLMSPNGHGGSFRALQDSGALSIMEEEGIDYLSYFQVDNPLVYCLDPTFIGLHQTENSEMSSKAVKKINSRERVGTFLKLKDKLHVVEYSDIPSEISQQKNSEGALSFSLGSIAIHLINRSFIQKLVGKTKDKENRLPYHGALKPVSHLDLSGNYVQPTKPNALKAETFVFDALPLAQKPLILEIDRKEEFAPIKNAQGTDSLQSSQELQLRRAKKWLNSAKNFKDYENVEIASSFAPTWPHFIKKISLIEDNRPNLSAKPNIIFQDLEISYQ